MKRVLPILFVMLLLNSSYIAALPSATVFYMGNMLLHVLLGVACAAGLLWLLRRPDTQAGMPVFRATLFMAAAALGLYLTFAGATTPHRWVVWVHIGLA